MYFRYLLALLLSQSTSSSHDILPTFCQSSKDCRSLEEYCSRTKHFGLIRVPTGQCQPTWRFGKACRFDAQCGLPRNLISACIFFRCRCRDNRGPPYLIQRCQYLSKILTDRSEMSTAGGEHNEMLRVFLIIGIFSGVVLFVTILVILIKILRIKQMKRQQMASSGENESTRIVLRESSSEERRSRPPSYSSIPPPSYEDILPAGIASWLRGRRRSGHERDAAYPQYSSAQEDSIEGAARPLLPSAPSQEEIYASSIKEKEENVYANITFTFKNEASEKQDETLASSDSLDVQSQQMTSIIESKTDNPEEEPLYDQCAEEDEFTEESNGAIPKRITQINEQSVSYHRRPRLSTLRECEEPESVPSVSNKKEKEEEFTNEDDIQDVDDWTSSCDSG